MGRRGRRVVGWVGKLKAGPLCHWATDSVAVFSVGDMQGCTQTTGYRMAGNIGMELYLAVGERSLCRQILIRQYNFIV